MDITFNSKKHLGIKCKFCGYKDFSIDRYKCTICNDYDLCGKCFEDRKFNMIHKKNHPMIRFSDPNEIFGIKIDNNFNFSLFNFHTMFMNFIHYNITCNACYMSPIIGIRLKCDECVDYDLCSYCYHTKLDTSNHSLLIVNNEINKISKNDILLNEKLGSGGFGTVYKAKYLPNNKTVACKVFETNELFKLNLSIENLLNIPALPSFFQQPQSSIIAQALNIEKINMKSDFIFQSYINEIKSYNELYSNNIVKMIGYFNETNLNSTKYYLIMEYMEKGSLNDVIKNEPNLSYEYRLQIAINIISGMRRIHDKGFIHRDIRPDNILISQDYIAKIGDMGIAKYIDQFNRNQTLIGCGNYMPKEFYTGQYTSKLDIFTFGLTIYNLFSGKRHTQIGLTHIFPEKSPTFQYLIDKCIDDNPYKRPTALEIEKLFKIHHFALNHMINNTKNYNLLNNNQKLKICIETHNLVEKQMINQFIHPLQITNYIYDNRITNNKKRDNQKFMNKFRKLIKKKLLIV